MAHAVYNTRAWSAARELALARDRQRCLVSRLIGGRCCGPLHVHHLIRPEDGGDPYDVDNLGTVCAAHHPTWEAVRRALQKHRGETPRCHHEHRTLEGRRICEARLASARSAA